MQMELKRVEIEAAKLINEITESKQIPTQDEQNNLKTI